MDTTDKVDILAISAPYHTAGILVKSGGHVPGRSGCHIIDHQPVFVRLVTGCRHTPVCDLIPVGRPNGIFIITGIGCGNIRCFTLIRIIQVDIGIGAQSVGAAF